MSVDTSIGERLVKLTVTNQGIGQNAEFGWFRAKDVEPLVSYKVRADPGNKIQKGAEIECTIKFSEKDGKLNAWMVCLGEKSKGGFGGKGGAPRNPDEVHWESFAKIIAAAISVPGDSADMMHRRCEFGVSQYRKVALGASDTAAAAPTSKAQPSPSAQLLREYALSQESLIILGRINPPVTQLKETLEFIQTALGQNVDGWIRSRPNAKTLEDLRS